MPKRRRAIKLAPIDLDFFEKKKRLRIQPRFVLVAFGDTIKFREWEDLYLVSSWESWKFVERLYREFTRLRNGSVYVKPLADGFMAVRELSRAPRVQAGQTVEFLRRCCKVAGTINKIVRRAGLEGFRIRVVAGYVGRLEVIQMKHARLRQVDYTGKPVSLAFSLLPVEPRLPCVCYDNVKAIADQDPGRAQEIVFSRLDHPRDSAKRLEKRILRKIWAFGIRLRRERVS